MNFFKKKRLLIASVVYWFLLLYVIAQLVWWFIELQHQSEQMTKYKMQELHPGDPYYLSKNLRITLEAHNKTAQYVGEGSIFLLLILIGAIFVYRAVRRQIRMQQQQQHFMMTVTHELKTPIAVTKLNLETLLRYKLDEQKQQQIIRTALQETERLNNLANNVLISSQLEDGGYQLAEEEVDLSSLTTQVAKDFQARFPEKKWHLTIGKDLFVKGDVLLLQMLVMNLVGNAIKYAPRESMIVVELLKETGFIFLRVKDEGTGIPDNEKKKIFDKFYRAGNEATRNIQGTGLGLYLCRKIAVDHHAQLTVSDNSPAGSIFTVRFEER
jgi:two-component system sensor histidine kinase CiaH